MQPPLSSRNQDSPEPDNGSNTPIRVLICERNTLFNDLLTVSLSVNPGTHVVASVGDSMQALAAAELDRPDVVVLAADLGSQPTGIQTAYRIKAGSPSTGIVILSSRRDRSRVAALANGRLSGWTFLLKENLLSSAMLVRAIKGAAEGLVSVDPEIEVEQELRGRSILERLTRFQLSVLRLMSGGYSDEGIAEQLDMTTDRVARTVASICRDLHIPSDGSGHDRVRVVLVYLKETARIAP